MIVRMSKLRIIRQLFIIFVLLTFLPYTLILANSESEYSYNLVTLQVGNQPTMAYYDPTNGYVYVLNIGSNSTSVIYGNKLLTTILLTFKPSNITFDLSNGYAYIWNNNSDIVIIDGSKVLASLSLNGSITNVVYDKFNGYVYVTSLIFHTPSSRCITLYYGYTLYLYIIHNAEIIKTYEYYFISFLLPDSGLFNIFSNPSNGYVYFTIFEMGYSCPFDSINVIDGSQIVYTVNYTIESIPFSSTLFSFYNPLNNYTYIELSNATVVVFNGINVVSTFSLNIFAFKVAYDPYNGYEYLLSPFSIGIINDLIVVGYIYKPVNLPFDKPSYTLLNMVVNPTNGYVYAIVSQKTSTTNAIGSQNYAIVIKGTQVINNVSIGEGYSNECIGISNGYVYVSSNNEVYIFEGEKVVSTISINDAKIFTINDLTYLLASLSNYVLVLNGTHIIAKILTGSNPTYAIYDTSNEYVYIINTGSNSVTVIIPYYKITFVESGLPPNTKWSVSLNGSINSSTSNEITFSVPPGTYLFTITPPNGYVVSTSQQIIVVNSSITIHVTFSKLYYIVKFIEQGLPIGTSWSVTINGITKSSTNEEITFSLPEGQYSYSVLPITNYNATPAYGTISVNSNLTVHITFIEISKQVNVGSGPTYIIIDPYNGLTYVLDSLSNSVTILKNSTVVGNINVGNCPISGVFDPSNGYIYVVNKGSNSVTVISDTTVLKTIKVGSNPTFALYDPQNSYVYITGANSVYVIDELNVIGSLPANNATFALYDPQNSYVYVINNVGPYMKGYVLVITGVNVIANITVGPSPVYAFYNLLNNYVYVIDWNGPNAIGYISVIQNTNLVSNIQAGISPTYGVFDPSDGYAYVSTNSSILALNGTKIVSTILDNLHPEYLVYDPTDGLVYVLNNRSNQISVLSNLTIIQNLSVELKPSYATIDPFTNTLLLSGLYSNSVSIMPALQSGSEKETITFVEDGLPSGALWSVTLNGITEASSSNEIVFTVKPGVYYYVINNISGYVVTPKYNTINVKSNITVQITFTKRIQTSNVTSTSLTTTQTSNSLPVQTSVNLSKNLMNTETPTLYIIIIVIIAISIVIIALLKVLRKI